MRAGSVVWCDNYLSTSFWPPTLVTAAMYLMIIFDASVLPAPDSPVKFKDGIETLLPWLLLK